jgi:predicted kinase
MKNNNLILIRGLPGSGKSTLAKQMVMDNPDLWHFEADQYFTDKFGVYEFNVNNLSDAHEWCRQRTIDTLNSGESVVVSNTFTTAREMQPYFTIAKSIRKEPIVITLTAQYGNIHNVPETTLEKMKARFLKCTVELMGKS